MTSLALVEEFVPCCVECGSEKRLYSRNLCHPCYDKARSQGKLENYPLPPRLDKREAMHTNPDDPRHGTTNGYRNLRCRCERCTEANRVDVAAWRSADSDRNDLYISRRVRSRASRLPRNIPDELREQFAAERRALALKQAVEMDELINKQMAAVKAPLWRVELAQAEERATRLREQLDALQAPRMPSA